jgi:predicted O-methyltransferase YrrM
MKSFQELIDISNTFDLGFVLERVEEPHHNSLRMSNHYHPWSLQEAEARIVYDTVITNNLKAGVEIATAFGMSSTVMGQALKVTGGKIATIDAYVEEHFSFCGSYGPDTRLVKSAETADGFKMANAFIRYLDLTNTVFTEVGWSPDVVPSVVEKHFPSSKLDFAFIDGGHTVEQIHADVLAVLPFLGKDAMIIFHDHQVVGEHTLRLLNEEFTSSKKYETHFHLTMYSRGDKQLLSN